jgi:chromosome partitioning protein
MVANDANDQRTTMKTVAIISQKGGAGKTTIAIHLAVAAEKRGMKTALFDLDPQASASSRSDKRNQPAPAVVPAQAGRLPGLLEQAKGQSADLVIIDSPPNADAASLAAAQAADLILVPCRPSAFDLNAIGTTLSLLAIVAGKPAYVVLNAVPPLGNVGELARRALEECGVEVAAPVLYHLVAFAHAVNDGRTAQELGPKSKAALEIDALFRTTSTSRCTPCWSASEVFVVDSEARERLRGGNDDATIYSGQEGVWASRPPFRVDQ